MPDEQAEIVNFLSAGASHGLAGMAVERIDTHASSVFLAGDHVYKLKRAIAFSYLDYSTREKREAACRAELALNRRTAPEIYLGVKAITREADGRLAFDGDGEALDWVVAMRRFDAEGLFDRMAASSRLTQALMRELADRIAAFHAGAELRRDQGGAAAIANVIDGNDQNLRRAGALFDQAKVNALTAASHAALRRVARLLDRRRGEGKVRRCHGDLHLGNICLVEGRPVLFDAIEFSDAIAIIDMLYDLAFLLMDLGHRGLGGFANLVFNRYLDQSREDDGLAALPLFLSLRAAIRAHVIAAALARQPDDKRAAEAVAYLDFAQKLLEPATPRLVAMGGLSGTGKSTLAAALAPDLAPLPGARLLRSDMLRKAQFGVPPETRLPPSAYDRATARRVYDALNSGAATALDAGRSAIVDAVFLEPAERRAIAAVAAAQGCQFSAFWLEAPRDILVARIEARRGDASDADRAVLERQLAADPGALDWQRLDVSGAREQNLAALRRALEPAPQQA